MATHSSILAWEISWTEESGGLYSPWGCKRFRHDLATKQQSGSINGQAHAQLVKARVSRKAQAHPEV